jgi:hypothetical protein
MKLNSSRILALANSILVLGMMPFLSSTQWIFVASAAEVEIPHAKFLQSSRAPAIQLCRMLYNDSV